MLNKLSYNFEGGHLEISEFNRDSGYGEGANCIYMLNNLNKIQFDYSTNVEQLL